MGYFPHVVQTTEEHETPVQAAPVYLHIVRWAVTGHKPAAMDHLREARLQPAAPAPELPALEVVCMLGEFRSVMSSTPFGHVDRMLNRVGVGVLLHQRLDCSRRSPSPPV